MSIPSVPKPSSPGEGKVAIANTRAAYVNVRTGPGTNYLDIGDIRNNTLVYYYPNTETGGWYWVEQYGMGGWTFGGVITFEETNAATPSTPNQSTPYDGKVMVWHWKGDAVPYNSIDEMAQEIKRLAPEVKAICVKTSDFTRTSGARWQGHWDTDRNLAIDGPASIDRWVQTLDRYGLEFHAWCVPRGIDRSAETNLIIQACERPGVKSMILDVEPYEGFWSAPASEVRPYMTAIRRGVGGRFHIAMAVDARPQHYDSIFPLEWLPFVNSVHSQSYWETFRRPVSEVLQEAYSVWGGYGRPLLPILQGDADPIDMATAHTLATQRHGARGVSWWRVGVIGPVEWNSINQPIDIGTLPSEPNPTDPETPTYVYGDELVILPNGPGFIKGTYTGQQEFREFQGSWGWDVFYKETEASGSTVYTGWTPRLSDSAKYEIATFIPMRNATTRKARYKIQGVAGAGSEVLVEVDQSRYRNQWVSLGVFDIDTSRVNAGAVFVNDLTGENDKLIAFDAMRWRKVVGVVEVPGGGNNGGTPPNSNGGVIIVDGVYYADGYDSPVGTAAERRTSKVWPGQWRDASPFAVLYFQGTPSEAYHTGADLNLPADRDRLDNIYAVASGVVTYAGRASSSWGNVIVIRHDPLWRGRQVMYSRSSHVANMQVKVGDRVVRGQTIAQVGNANGRWAYHLHFDLSPTSLLATRPGDWPGRDLSFLLQNYVDPREFILNNRPGS